MDGQFIPLVHPPDGAILSGGSLRKPTDSAQASAAFRSLNLPAGSSSAESCSSTDKPSVTLQREGDRVTQIRIRCVCGEVIELDCVY